MKKFNLTEDNQRRVLIFAVLAWALLNVVPIKILPSELVRIINPFLIAYVVEYLVKILDDMHLPNQDFHIVVHLVLSAVAGTFALSISDLLLGAITVPWSIFVFGLAALVYNWLNLVWTINESKEAQNEE